MNQPIIIGHRGAAGHAPENTRAAFARAVGLGVDAVEFDVQFTADGCPVVFHDETMKRMGGAALRIRDYTHPVLERLDIGFLHDAEFRGERIPQVEDVARLVPPEVELHVEIKDCDPVLEEHLLGLIGALERCGGLSRIVFSSPHEEMLVSLRKLAPRARTALLLFGDVRVPTDAARRAAHIGCSAVDPNMNLVSAELVDVCHRHHMNVFAFTVNERGTMRKLLALGVDGFFTDYPDRLLDAAAAPGREAASSGGNGTPAGEAP